MHNVICERPLYSNTCRNIQFLLLNLEHRQTSVYSAVKTFAVYYYSGCHQKVYECCFMKQNCHFQSGVLQCKIATKPLISSGIHTTHQHFQKRYITLLLPRGLKSYQPSKFESLYFLSKTHFTFLSWPITVYKLYYLTYIRDFWLGDVDLSREDAVINEFQY